MPALSLASRLRCCFGRLFGHKSQGVVFVRANTHTFSVSNTIQSDCDNVSVIADPRAERSAVAKPVRRTLPPCYTVGNHARGLHGGFAKLRVPRDLPLYALTFGVQQFAQALKFGD